MPNIFTHIQRVYWDNRLFGFLYRSPDHIIVALPMIIFTVYITGKFLMAQPLNILTFGVFGINEERSDKDGPLFENPVLVPFFWNFLANMLLVILFANIDIISRVASTNVVYYWAFALLISNKPSNYTEKVMTWLVVLHNLAYMALNLQLFLTETAFF